MRPLIPEIKEKYNINMSLLPTQRNGRYTFFLFCLRNNFKYIDHIYIDSIAYLTEEEYKIMESAEGDLPKMRTLFQDRRKTMMSMKILPFKDYTTKKFQKKKTEYFIDDDNKLRKKVVLFSLKDDPMENFNMDKLTLKQKLIVHYNKLKYFKDYDGEL